MLTILRILLIPVFLFFLFADNIGYNYLISFFLFIGISLTDALDGYIARSRNVITNFGKFLDPVADKILVLSALISFVELGLVSYWVVILILSREFLITSFRLIAVDKGIVIVASNFGKIKTTIQFISIIVILLTLALPSIGLDINYNSIRLISEFLLIFSAIISVFSGLDYVIKNKNVIADKKN